MRKTPGEPVGVVQPRFWREERMEVWLMQLHHEVVGDDVSSSSSVSPEDPGLQY